MALLLPRKQVSLAHLQQIQPSARRCPRRFLTDLKGGKMTSGAKFRAGIPSRACGARAFHL